MTQATSPTVRDIALAYTNANQNAQKVIKTVAKCVSQCEENGNRFVAEIGNKELAREVVQVISRLQYFGARDITDVTDDTFRVSIWKQVT